MDDFIIFLAGFFVTMMVAAAVALLVWGASQEPSPAEPMEKES